MAGFKTYSRTNLGLGAAAVLREDVVLQVGAAAESVTVNEAASLLSTESADVAHNITVNQLGSLPILGIGAASARASGHPQSLCAAATHSGQRVRWPNRIMVIKRHR